MVRETRYLLVGNLPEKTTEEEITEYFKRYGKIQTVKLQPRPDSPRDKEPEEGETSSSNTLSATVAFTDIKSASNAHKAENKIGANVLTSEYSEGLHKATGSVVKRTREPEIYPRAPPGAAPGFPNRKGFEEEVDGFDVYYGSTQQYNDAPYPPPSPNLQTRGRPLERTWGRGGNFNRGAKWSPGAQGTMRIYTECGSKDVFDPVTATPTTPSTPSAPQPAPCTSNKPAKKKSKKSRADSQSSSPCSRHSSTGSDTSTGSSKERKTVASTVTQKTKEVEKEAEKDEIEPGEREPLGVYIRKLPLRSSDTSLRDGLFHEYKKYGKITAVQVSGVQETRYAIVSFKQAEDASKALTASHDKTFFGSRIVASQHEGLEVEDADFQPPEAHMDEHHPKSTRTLFLGNLNKEISVEELKEKLIKYGEILDVDVKRSGAVTAYGFVQYSDITSVVNSLKDLEGANWDGIKLKVGFGKSMASPVIWLDNIADTVNETFLCRQFSRYGGISHAVIDRVKARALVFFMNIECAQYALPEMRNRIWNGKKIHIDFASRDCQEAFFKKMEESGQLRAGERPEPRTWINKPVVGEQWDDKHAGGFAGQVGRGRGRFIRGRGTFRGRGHSFEGAPFSDDYTGKRRQVDEYSTGSGPYPSDDQPYDEALREFGHSQRERRERPHSPTSYDDAYFEAGSQTSRDYDMYDKIRYDYRSLSPSSDRELDITDDDYKFKTRTADERYYYKDKYYELETKSRDRSHSSDSEQRYRVASEIVTTHISRSRSPTSKHKRAKDLPISYRSQSPPTPTDDEPQYYNSRDHSPTDFDSAIRKYEKDFKKRLSSSVEGDKHNKSSVLSITGLRKEIEAKVEDRSSRKRSYDQVSPKRDRLERQLSHGSKSSLYDYDRHEKLSAKELLTKVARLKSEVHERTGKGSPSSLSSHSDIDPSTLSEAELAKLHHEKLKLLDKLTMLDDKVSNSDEDSNSDMRRVSKKARIDEKIAKYFQKSDLQNMTKHELKEKLKLLDVTQSCRKQMEALRKKEKERDLIRELKKTKSASDIKKEMLDYSDDENQLLNSPKEIPSGFMPKKRRKLEGDMDRKSRSYRVRKDHDDDSRLSGDEKDVDLLQRQISAHSDLFSRSRSASSMDIHLENDSLYSASGALTIYGKDESRRISSGSESNKDKEHSEHKSSHRRRSKNKHDENWITPLIPLGEDDDMPDPEVEDPRPRPRKSDHDLPMALPLPKFAQYIQFSPVGSPHDSNKSHSDLSKTPTPPRGGDSRISHQNDTGAAVSDQPYPSPCFSPQSSSSKTHSPSNSPSGSENNSKGNTNSSDNNEEPLGFPKDAEMDDPLDENKPDSLDSLPACSKTDRRKDSLSDNSDLSDHENTSSENLSIEERIRLLDEKWSKAQARVAATSKTIPDVESVVCLNISSSPSLVSLPIMGTPVSSVATSPAVSSLYSKFRIRKKNETSAASADKSEPSEIVKTVLSKSSIFDQDSERLGQINSEMYDSKDCNSNSEMEESSPQLLSVRTKAEAKEMPMVTLPGSLMERLGQNMSFPTLTVNTSLANQMLLSSNGNNGNKSTEHSMCNNLQPPENVTAKTSPVIKSSVSPIENGSCESVQTLGNTMPSIDGPITPRSHNSELDLQPPVLETPQKNDISWKAVESVKTETEIRQAPELERQSDNTSNSEIKSSHVPNTSDSLNDTDNLLDLKPYVPKSILKNSPSQIATRTEPLVPVVKDMNSEDVAIPANDSITESKINSDTAVKEEPVKLENSNTIENSPNSVDETPNRSAPSTPVKVNNTVNKDTDKKDTPKKELSVTKDTISRSAFDVDIFSTSSHSKRKTDEAKAAETKLDVKSERNDKKEKESDMEVDSESPVTKSELKTKTSEKVKVKSNKEKSKSTKSESSHEPNKKQKLLKDKRSDSVHKEDKHKKKDTKVDSDKKASHKSGSDKKEDKKDKHKDKQKVDKDTKKDGEKKQQKDDRKEKDEKKKKETEKKAVKDDKKDKHDEKKEHVSKDKSEKKAKSDSSKKDKEKHDGHKHDKHGLKSPDKKSVKQNKESTDTKESVKDSEKNDKKSEHDKKSDHSHKKEHKSSTSSSSSHSSKIKRDNSESKKNKDDHNENKKKDTVSNSKDKDSPDKSKDQGSKRTENPPEKKEETVEKSKESKEKNTSSGKCKDETNKEKEKEHKDKDPDNSRSKPKGGSSSGNIDKLKHQSSDKKMDKSKPDTDKSSSTKNEKKSETSKEEKKSKASKTSKSSNPTKSSAKDKSKTDSTSKSSSKSTNKSNESSDKGSTKDTSKETNNSKDTNESKSKDKESKDHESPHNSDKKTPDHHKEHKSEVERLELMMFDSYEPYVSMYDKVKRRSTDKKDNKVKDVPDFTKKVNNYKKHSYKKKFNLSDVSESSDLSSMDELTPKKITPKPNKKKFVFSSGDCDSSTGDEMLMKQKQKTKIQTKKPKRILDVYSTDSEEEEKSSKTPSKKQTSSGEKDKKLEADEHNNYHFDFESLSDTDHKFSNVKPAKSKTAPKNKKTKTTKNDHKANAKTENKPVKKPIKPKVTSRKVFLKDLFSDDSDDSDLSDSDSDNIVMKSKPKKKVDPKKNKMIPPKGSFIYTTSEDSDSDGDEYTPFSPPPKKSPPKKVTKKEQESDTLMSDPDPLHQTKDKKKETKKIITTKKLNDSFSGSDHLMSDPEISKIAEHKNQIKENKTFEKIQNDYMTEMGGGSMYDLIKLEKMNKQREKEKLECKVKEKETKKNKKNRQKSPVIFSDSERKQLEVSEVYSETVFEKDEFNPLANLTNKTDHPPLLSECNKEALFKLDHNINNKIIPNLKEMNFIDKAVKNKTKKHKDKSKKKKKNKEKDEKHSPKQKLDFSGGLFGDFKSDDEVKESAILLDKSENIKPESDTDINTSGNSTRNLFEELNVTPEKDKKVKKQKDSKEHNEPKKEINFAGAFKKLTEGNHLSDSDHGDRETKMKHNDEKVDFHAGSEKNELLYFSEDSSKYDPGKTNADVFEFKEDDDEDTNLMPLKESHVKIMKPDSYGVDLANDDDDKVDDSANMPIEVQEVEIEVQEHEDVCTEVETSEVVIEMKSDASVKPEKSKPKPRKRRGRKNSGKEILSEEHEIAASLGIEVRPSAGCTDLTIEAVSTLEKVDRNGGGIHTETVTVEAPVSNGQELVIDEGVSLHVEDETAKAIESITLNQNEAEADETAKAVESILFGDEIPYSIPDPQTNAPLDQSYLQPDFSQLEGVPQLETEVETTVTEKQASTPKGRPKGRRGRTKSATQNKNHVLESIENVSQGTTETHNEADIPNQKQDTVPENQPYNNILNDDSYFSEASNQHNQNDDDVGLAPLQIDLDPPKREPKQRKARKPKQTKGSKLAEAAVLAAESMFDKEVSELNRDSISSDNSELERSKHEDLLFMDREDQRHDSDLLSPDERSTSEDLTSPDSAKPRRRGRKPKNYKEMNSGVSHRTNSPRATRTMSPRSPRSNDPKSPKYDIGSPATRTDKASDVKPKSGKGFALEDGDMKENMIDKLAMPNFEEKSLKGGVNVFDFNDNDESSLVIEVAQTPKRGRQRGRKKAESMQSPEHGLLSPGENKLIIGSPDAKFNSPERKMQVNTPEKNSLDMKTGMFSPRIEPEEQKIDVNTVSDDKPPEPLFKAFFEAKSKSGKGENDRIQPVVISRRPSGGLQDLKVDLETANESAANNDKLLSPTGMSKAQISQNVDKTINDVSKGLFQCSTDDESYKSDMDDLVGLKDPSKKRQSRKSKEEKQVPTVNNLQSPPPVVSHVGHPLTLPGMGMPMISSPIGEPQVIGHMGLLGQMSPPISMAARGQGKGQPLSELENHHANQQPASKPGVSVTANLLSPGKSVTSVASITTMATSTPVSVLTSAGNSKQEPLKCDRITEGALKNAMPGVLVPGVSATSVSNIIQSIPSVSTPISNPQSDVAMTVSDSQRKQLELQKLEHQKLEQQKEQKMQLEQQNELKKQHELQLQMQQEEQIKLREQEQHRLMEQHAKLQEQHKHMQQQEMMKQEQMHAQQLEKQKHEQQKFQREQQKKQQELQKQEQQILQQEHQKHQQEQQQKMMQQQEQQQQQEHQKLHEMQKQELQQAMQQKEQSLMQQQQQGQQLLQEHKKHLQEKQKQLEQHLILQQQAAFQAASGQPNPSPMLSPGILQGPRPSLPSPGSNQGPRPPLSAHHPMPPAAAFGLPGQHPGAMPVRPGQFPPHLTPAQMSAMSHMISPLGHDKPPTSQELAMKHQQLQLQIAAQAQAQVQAQKGPGQGPQSQTMTQKAHNQSLAEQQAQMAKQQAQQAQAHAKQQAQQSQQQMQQNQQPGPQNQGPKLSPMLQGPPPGNKGPDQQAQGLQSPPINGRKEMLPHPQGPPLAPPMPGIQDGPRPGSQEAANQLQAHIKQQLAMQSQTPGGGPLPPPGWPQMQIRPEGPGMISPEGPGMIRPEGPGMIRPEGPGMIRPESPGMRQGDDLRGNVTEAMTSMPGPVLVLGGNPQQAQRVSPHPSTKSPTVAQTAPNMGLGFSQHQASAPRAPSPAVAKTAERQAPGGGKWSGSPGAQRPGQSDVRPRAPSTETSPTTSRAEHWSGMQAPPGQPPGLNLTPRPAHQQPPAAHQQQTDHALPRQRPPAPELGAKDKFMQQQREKQMQQEIQRQKEQLLQQQHDLRQRELQQQELRERQLREQAIHAQAQKEVQKEREEREKREARAGMTSQSPSDPRQSPANGPLPHRMGYPFTEPRPPSRDSKITPQSPGIVDPRDPRFAGQFTNIPGGPHPTDLRMGSSQAPSAFSPAAAGSGDSPHMYTPAEIQRLQQNGLIPAYPPGLRMLEPHMMAGHAPYMLPGGVHHLAYMAQQMDHPHLVDGRPPSRGSAQPPPNQPPGHNSNQNQTSDDRARQPMGPPSRPGSDVAQPGDGSLLSLLQRYPVMWQGILALKNDQCVVQMHFISGCQPLVKLSLPQQAPDNTMQPLRIAQRMRLEQTQLEGVAKRMTLEKDYCMMLALPCGRDHTDIYQQTRAMSTGFIQYLQQKQAAGIVNVADPGSQQPAYVVHIFPPCEFSQTTLSRLGFGLLYQVKDLAHLIVIIATVA